jgi:hypothetical protein
MKRILVIAVFAAQLAFAASWTDRAEYDLVLKIRSEASPQQRIALLDDWKAKYPKTGLGEPRRELYLAAYRELGNVPKMLDIVKEIVADQPDNEAGVYWAAILVPLAKDADAATQALGATAAQQMLAARDKYFSATLRPAAVTEAEWTAQSTRFEFLAHRALGWLAWQHNSLPEAETELTAASKLEPQDAEVEGWLGAVLAQEQTPQKESAAIWQLARATAVKGDGALADSERGQFLTSMERLYTQLNGDKTGLEQLKTDAAAAPFSPPGFEIGPFMGASATDSAANSAIWVRLRTRLAAADGDTYFTTALKGREIPLFKGKVVRCTPRSKPQEVGLAITDDTTEEVILTLNPPLASAARPGTDIEFKGQASSFAVNPFRLTLTAEPEDLVGWPNAPAKKK